MPYRDQARFLPVIPPPMSPAFLSFLSSSSVEFRRPPAARESFLTLSRRVLWFVGLTLFLSRVWHSPLFPSSFPILFTPISSTDRFFPPLAADSRIPLSVSN